MMFSKKALLIGVLSAGVVQGQQFPFTVAFDSCVAGSTNLEFECFFTQSGSSASISVDTYAFQLYGKDCTGAAPTGVTAAGLNDLVKTITVTDSVAENAANTNTDVEFCLELQIGIGGVYYDIARQNIAIDFAKDGEFSTTAQIVATEVGGPQTVDVDFGVTATICGGTGTLESGDDLYICIDVDEDATTAIVSVDSVTITKATAASSPFDAVTNSGAQGLTNIFGLGSGDVTVVTVLDTSFFEDADPVDIVGTVTLEVDTLLRNLQEDEEGESMKKEVVDVKYRLLQDLFEDEFSLEVNVVADTDCSWLCLIFSFFFGWL